MKVLTTPRMARCIGCHSCSLACPTGAYSQRRGGGVLVKKKLCNRCKDCEKACPVDAMSAGVALAWATEALEKGIISKEETDSP